ncbi:MAG: DNA polymerase III subunit delta [Clostridium sp.]|nr:DNA polymerase III subunit delta [Clostridium sp.]MCM1546887.1 DNA polymerase III subunit delta [Ruminococcus sp.]
MAEITPSELLKKIKSGEFCSAYYIYGKDIANVENAACAILKKRLGKDWKNSATHLTGEELNVSALIDMLEMYPMFSEVNAVFINDLNAEELSADDLKALTDAVKNIPEYTMLVINITGFDVKKGKKTMTAKNKKLADSISKVGLVCECGLRTVSEHVKSITAKAHKRGCEISKKSAETLAELCGNDALRIENELEKLCAYRENSEICQDDILNLVSSGIETDAFRLSRAISSYNPSLAMEIVNKLIAQRNDPVPIISAMSMSFIDLYRARTAMKSGRQAADVIEDFGYTGRKFAVDNAFRDSRRISAEALRKCVLLLRNADRSLKQTGAIPTLILEKTVTEMLIAVRKK